ncbi:MAG: hypothetical protein ERJ68_02155 [Aphanocapsa feldmannii 277cI]|uniref:Uncharacterized protein n=1 Tax=Aphanocapsa feldmannii 277cI TaxID=2507554 RepID=A0A524RUX8_9CHRO|nr:MAG: hypothetical protein ERJ68_02155 [Aphanocapsa feldmannii 277cI]
MVPDLGRGLGRGRRGESPAAGVGAFLDAVELLGFAKGRQQIPLLCGVEHVCDIALGQRCDQARVDGVAGPRELRRQRLAAQQCAGGSAAIPLIEGVG